MNDLTKTLLAYAECEEAANIYAESPKEPADQDAFSQVLLRHDWKQSDEDSRLARLVGAWRFIRELRGRALALVRGDGGEETSCK